MLRTAWMIRCMKLLTKHWMLGFSSPLLLLYQLLSHTYIHANLYTNVQHTYLYCFIFETRTQAVVHKVHAWMCPKWLNRILLSLKMCEYATKHNYCMTCVCKEVFTSWYVLKYYRQFSLKMVVLKINYYWKLIIQIIVKI